MVFSFLNPKGIYRKWSLNILDFILMANISVSSLLLALHAREKKWSEYIHRSSVTIALLSFLFFILYDRSAKFKSLLMKLKKVISLQRKKKEELRQTTTRSSFSVSSLRAQENSPLLPSQVLPAVINYKQFREPLIEEMTD